MMIASVPKKIVDAIMSWPLPMLVIGLLMVAGAVAGLIWQSGDKTARAGIRLAPIVLNLDAETPDALVTPLAPDMESRQTAILSQTLIQDAIGHDGSPKTKIAADAIGLDAADSATIAKVLLDKLAVNATDDPNRIEIALRSPKAAAAVDTVQAIAAAYAVKQESIRRRQKSDAMAWIDRHQTSLQARADDTKAAIVDSPLDPDLSRLTPQTESETLLRQMIDAARDAQSSAAGKLRDRDGQAPGRKEEGGISPADRDYASLSVDIERMTAALDQIEQDRARQKDLIVELKDAKSGLTSFQEQVDIHLATNILDSPAAELMPAVSTGPSPVLQWLRRGLALMLIIGIGLALTSVIGLALARRRRDRNGIEGPDFLNDPNWPRPARTAPDD